MNKIANVVYSYTPKNSDELELKVGDKIEVIGYEEAGWWRGRTLKGITGVFPSNFVKLEQQLPANNNLSLNTNNQGQLSSKLNLFVNKLPKPNLSTNNSISVSNNGNMTSLSQTDGSLEHNHDLANHDESTNNISLEKRPKPIRGIGYGDIFSGGKPKLTPVDMSLNSSIDRINSSLVGQTQKLIPKKPPPPTPEQNNLGSDHAPPPPPKPINHFSTLSPMNRLPSGANREQVKVIYAYQALNDDELTIKAGDIIDVISKEIEDQGWWKGELNGKVGVFPDNFVEPIKTPIPDTDINMKPHQSFIKNLQQPTVPFANSNAPTLNDIEKSRSLMTSSQKNLCREFEQNFEKNGTSPASFLSLKRNKLQQSTVSMKPKSSEQNSIDDPSNEIRHDNNLSNVSSNNSNINNNSHNSDPTNSVKLNHMTTNRAKGPARRPPSSVLNKRGQSELISRPSNVPEADDNNLNSTNDNIVNPSPLIHKETTSPASQSGREIINSTNKETKSTKPVPLEDNKDASKLSMSLDNIINEHNLSAGAPRAFQRSNQTNVTDKIGTTNSPQWMLDLRKAHAEKKRESSIVIPKVPEPVTQTLAVDNDKAKVEITAPEPVVKTIRPNVEEQIAPIPTVTSEEVDILKEELRLLKLQVSNLSSLPGEIDEMKRLMKSLFGVLADERKKIAAMQIELDSNSK